MFDTLYGKTFLILAGQLTLTWMSAAILMTIFRRLYTANVSWIAGTTNERGEITLDLDKKATASYFWILIISDFIVSVALILTAYYYPIHILLAILLFTVWSVLGGSLLAMILISVDEHLASRVLALTALITVTAGLIGAKSGIDFSGLESGLFYSLLLLIALGIIRIFVSMPDWVQRLQALFGVAVFTVYLVFDFYRLNHWNSQTGSNNWAAALKLSINIYLDVINLFLYLLDLLSQFSK